MTIEKIPDPNEQPYTNIDNGEQTFDQFAATLPETAQGFLDNASSTHVAIGADGGVSVLGDADAPSETVRKTVKVSKKIRKAMDKMKTKTANIPIMWFHAQAKDHPEWELDDDEKEMLQDSISTVFDVLDIQIEIEPLEWTLTSIWWVVGYPILAFTFLFLTKKSLTIDKEQAEPDAQ